MTFDGYFGNNFKQGMPVPVVYRFVGLFLRVIRREMAQNLEVSRRRFPQVRRDFELIVELVND